MAAFLEPDGFAIVPAVFSVEEIDRLIKLLPDLGSAGGTRTLLNYPWARELAETPKIKTLVSSAIGPGACPTRAILFDKSPSANWVLGWHQDQRMAFPQRIEDPAYEGWSLKEGAWHCRPPVAVQERSVAVRIHLDHCGPQNGPLRVLPGTHLHGYREAPSEEEINGEIACVCARGDVLLMKPLLFHASGKAESPTHRRVIHIEFCSAPNAHNLL